MIVVHRFKGSGLPWSDGMWLWNSYHVLCTWLSITTSWHARSGPGVQRL